LEDVVEKMSRLQSRLSVWETRIQEKKLEATKSFVKTKSQETETESEKSPNLGMKKLKFDTITIPSPSKSEKIENQETQLNIQESIITENIKPVDELTSIFQAKKEEKLVSTIKPLVKNIHRGSVRDLIQNMESKTPRKLNPSPMKVINTNVVSSGEDTPNNSQNTSKNVSPINDKNSPVNEKPSVSPEIHAEKKDELKLDLPKTPTLQPMMKPKTTTTKSIVQSTFDTIVSPRRVRRTTLTPRKDQTTPTPPTDGLEKKRSVSIVHKTSDEALKNPKPYHQKLHPIQEPKQEKNEEEAPKHVDDIAKMFNKANVSIFNFRKSIKVDITSLSAVTPRDFSPVPTKPKNEVKTSSPRILHKIKMFEALSQGTTSIVDGEEECEFRNPLADEFVIVINELYEEAIMFYNPLADPIGDVINPLYDGERNYFGFEHEEKHDSLVLFLKKQIKFTTLKQSKTQFDNAFTGLQLFEAINELSQNFLCQSDIDFLIGELFSKLIIIPINLEKEFSKDLYYQFAEDRSKCSYFAPSFNIFFEPQNSDLLLRMFDYNFASLCEEFSIISREKYNNTIEYATLAKSKSFKEIEGMLYKFQKVDPLSLKENWKKSLFINLYNYLTLWCHVEANKDDHSTFVKRAKKFKKCRFNIGLFELSINIIENAILMDGTHEISIPQDIRMDFCLHKGTVSSPVLRFYSHSTVEDRMEEATKFFISISTEINDKTITLHPLLEQEKFGKYNEDKLNFIKSYLTPNQLDQINKIKEQGPDSLEIQFSKHDFTLNQKGMDQALVDVNFEFEQIISNPKYRVYFKAFCEKEFSTENILAWEHILRYRSLEDPTERFHKAIEIFNLYLSLDAPKMININRRPCDQIAEILDFERNRLFEDPSLTPTLEINLFEEVEKSLSTTMVDTYSRFKKEEYHELAKVIMDEMLEEEPKKNKNFKLTIFKQKKLKNSTVINNQGSGLNKSSGSLPLVEERRGSAEGPLSARDLGKLDSDIFVVKKKKRQGTEIQATVQSPRSSDGTLSSPRENAKTARDTIFNFKTLTTPRSGSSKNLSLSSLIPDSTPSNDSEGPPQKPFSLDSPNTLILKHSTAPTLKVKEDSSEGSPGSGNSPNGFIPMEKKREISSSTSGGNGSPFKLSAMKKSNGDRSPKRDPQDKQ
jgi:hypothetical protein